MDTTGLHQLIPALSTTLCSAGPDELDAAIESMFRRIGEATGVDRVALVEQDDHDVAAHSYRWSAAIDDAGVASQSEWSWDLQPERDVLVLDQVPDDCTRQTGLRSAVVVRVAIGREHAWTLALGSTSERHGWPAALVDQVRLLAEIVASALHRRRQSRALRQTEEEVSRLRAQVERESEPFDNDGYSPGFDEIVGRSPALKTALARLNEVAPTHSSVLLVGETGTGKELFARAIHERGPRRMNPLVVVNCAALPATLIESELFGHARGAFTGAITARQGRFELAHRGTLFLDEIGDLPLDLQTKLLRVLQEGTFERLGSSQTQKVDVRIIAATHRDLMKAVADGQFRDDLYYRLSVFPIRIPALRERRADIPELVWFTIHKRQRTMQRSIKRVPDAVMQALQVYDWPGNVRELENVIERALIHSTGDTLRLLDDHLGPVDEPESDGTLSSVERTHITDVLNACNWRINGAGNAAERLGMHPNTLRFRMKKLGIVRGAHDLADPDRYISRQPPTITRH